MSLFPRLASPDARLALLVDDGPRLTPRTGHPRSLDYATLARAVSAHVAQLDELGVDPGARVAIWAHSDLPTLVALVGNALAGVVSVPLSPKLGARELMHVLTDAEPAVVLASDVQGQSTPALPIRALETMHASEPPPIRALDDEPVLLLYTSGTTGAPKGVELSARGIAANLDALADAWAWTEADDVVHALPLFHVHGLVLGLFGALRMGGALRHVSRFDPAALGAQLAASPRAMLFAVPTMIHRLIDAAETDAAIASALGRVRLVVSGSAGLPTREHRRFEAITGRGVVERYGLTETLIVCGVRADEGARPGYVGRPLSGVEVRLVDDAGSVIDAHDDTTIGEVLVRGPSVLGGYLHRPDANEEAFDAEGFFRTGDLATRASDGALRIVGRKSTDLIKCGGFKIGAGEIEAVLLEQPGVREVAVVGMPDEDLGERIVAFVVADPSVARDADALIAAVARELAVHKRPREIRFVDDLPRNAMGKVQKAKLRA
ncbi:MAG: AMP-binding protein [Myxococcota bacterium]|nr:AMP-binding protein [Myxococcota bacterium]